MIEIGRVVISAAGRDKGLPFAVVATEGDNYVYLADGKFRKLGSPKKKKIKHVTETGLVLEKVADKIAANAKVFDAEIRGALRTALEEA